MIDNGLNEKAPEEERGGAKDLPIPQTGHPSRLILDTEVSREQHNASTRAQSVQLNSSGAFFLGTIKDERSCEVSILSTKQEGATFSYRENLTDVQTDVTEWLSVQRIQPTQFQRLVHKDQQSFVLGVPTYAPLGTRGGESDYFERVIDDLARVREGEEPFRSWPLELVINVNGLGQFDYFKSLERMVDYGIKKGIDVTVLHMPLGGRGKGDPLSGKANALNCIADYARLQGASVIGFMDDDAEFRSGNIYSNLKFLVEQSRSRGEPLLTGSQWKLQNNSVYSHIVTPALGGGPTSVLGISMFTFTACLPRIPSHPFNEDFYLNWYFVDSSKPSEQSRHRIVANDDAMVTWRVAQTLLGAFRQGRRWELGDRWAQELFSQEKQAMQQAHYGLRTIRDYLSSVTDRRETGESAASLGFVKTLPKFLLRTLLINHLVGVELWVRSKLGAPRYGTDWFKTVPKESKQ